MTSFGSAPKGASAMPPLRIDSDAPGGAVVVVASTVVIGASVVVVAGTVVAG